MFCYPENISAELRRVFDWLRRKKYLRGLSAIDFAKHAAWFLSEINAIHAFRDGNGRTQLSFLALLAAQAGHPLDLERLEPEGFLAAMIASFKGRERPLVAALGNLIER